MNECFEWIDVKQQLPKTNLDCIMVTVEATEDFGFKIGGKDYVKAGDRFVEFGAYNKHTGFYNDTGKCRVVAWSALPKPFVQHISNSMEKDASTI